MKTEVKHVADLLPSCPIEGKQIMHRLLMTFAAFGLLSYSQAISGAAPEANAARTVAGRHAYMLNPAADIVKIDTHSMMLEARWNLRWVPGGPQLFQTASAADVFQTKSNDRDLYATIALNGRDNPTASWRVVRFSLPSLAISAIAELNAVKNMPILLSASHVSVVVGWFDAGEMTTTLWFLNPATLAATVKKTLSNTVITNRAFLLDGTSTIIDGIGQIDVDTGASEVLPIFFALPAPHRSVLDKDFPTPDPAIQKPFTSLGVSDFTNGTLLVSAIDPKGEKQAFWTFDVDTRKTGGFYVTTSAVARITPSGALIVLQHTTGGMDSETTGSIEIIDTKTGESHKAHFSQLEGPLGSNHLICVADDSATFASEDGIYILPLPSATSLMRINTTFVTDKDQTCTLATQ